MVKRHVYVWTCCRCGYSGISIAVSTCTKCCTSRCAWCSTSKIPVRDRALAFRPKTIVTNVAIQAIPNTLPDEARSKPPLFSSTTPVDSGAIQDVKRDKPPEYIHCGFLGRGGFARVESVTHVETGNVYARKTYYVTAGIERAKTSFETEVAIMRKLQRHKNPHVVHFVEAFKCEEYQEFSLIFSPVADGGDLHRYLSQLYSNHGSLSDDVKLFFSDAIRDLACGLDFIHKTTIRHRDISPRNILIHEGRVIYTDFGIAFDFGARETSTTDTTHPCFQREYAAPELHEQQPRNHKSDIFSLGCVYFEIVAKYFDTADLKALTVYKGGTGYGYSVNVDKLQMVKHHGRIGGLCASMLRYQRDARPTAAEVALIKSGPLFT